MNRNYDYFMKADLSKFIGQWIAICGKKIISHGKNAKKVYNEAKSKCPKERPLLTKVPEKKTMIFNSYDNYI